LGQPQQFRHGKFWNNFRDWAENILVAQSVQYGVTKSFEAADLVKHDEPGFYRVRRDASTGQDVPTRIGSLSEVPEGLSANVGVNGLLNDLAAAVRNMRDKIGGKGDFILEHNPTHGIFADLFEASWDKLGGRSNQSIRLADLLQRLDPKTSHLYLHSQGALIGLSALSELRSRGVRMEGLEVNFFGSAANEISARIIMGRVGAKLGQWQANTFDPVAQLVGLNAITGLAPQRALTAFIGSFFIWGSDTATRSPHTLQSGGYFGKIGQPLYHLP
jgi:hypothetical protein